MPKLPPENTDWLSLSEASDLLGVHPTTLRAWADRGQLRTFRTPGGHRRFSAADLQRFLQVGSRMAPAGHAPSQTLLQDALTTSRREVADRGGAMPALHDRFDDAARASKRESGRQLLALAIRYAVRGLDQDQALAEARQLSRTYGLDAVQRGVRSADVARLVCMFRGALLEAIAAGPADGSDVPLREDIERFMEEVLFEMLEGHQNASQPLMIPPGGDSHADI